MTKTQNIIFLETNFKSQKSLVWDKGYMYFFILRLRNNTGPLINVIEVHIAPQNIILVAPITANNFEAHEYKKSVNKYGSIVNDFIYL